MDKTTETEKHLPQLAPGAFAQADFKRTVYAITVSKGVMPADVLSPAYWAFHAAKLKPWDEITAHAEDGTWYAQYLVLDCSRTWARVRPLNIVRLTDADVSESQASSQNIKDNAGKADYDVRFRGPKKWSVVRIADSALLTEGHSAKTEAQAWLDAHLTTTA